MTGRSPCLIPRVVFFFFPFFFFFPAGVGEGKKSAVNGFNPYSGETAQGTFDAPGPLGRRLTQAPPGSLASPLLSEVSPPEVSVSRHHGKGVSCWDLGRKAQITLPFTHTPLLSASLSYRWSILTHPGHPGGLLLLPIRQQTGQARKTQGQGQPHIPEQNRLTEPGDTWGVAFRTLCRPF